MARNARPTPRERPIFEPHHVWGWAFFWAAIIFAAITIGVLGLPEPPPPIDASIPTDAGQLP